MIEDPLSIVLQAAVDHATEIEYRSHSDVNIERGERIRVAARALSDPANIGPALAQAQRDWLRRLGTLVDERLQSGLQEAAGKLDEIMEALDGFLDGLGSDPAQPCEPVHELEQRVYVTVPLDTPTLGVFEGRESAELFAQRTNGKVREEFVMNDRVAAQVMAEFVPESPRKRGESDIGSSEPTADDSAGV